MSSVIEPACPSAALAPSQRYRLFAVLGGLYLAQAIPSYLFVAALPPINQFPLLPQPLRRVMGDDARRHDAALAAWAATRRDVAHVPISLQLAPGAMSRDGFHPGEPIYRACGDAIARFVAERVLPLETRR